MYTRSRLSVLARYPGPKGRPREVFTQAGAAGSLLLIDRDAATGGDRRLVAHLAADEPRANAVLACRDYLRHPHSRWCRLVTPEDLAVAPVAEADLEHPKDPGEQEDIEQPEIVELLDRHGHAYRVAPCSRGVSIPDLRWYRLPADGHSEAPGPVSVRDVIAALESYRPVRSLTARALARHRDDSTVSTYTLGAELKRVNTSQIVLNRGLREAVLATVQAQGLTLSEITIRCGRIKRCPRGNTSGDTSWLARRIGLAPENGRGAPTPWVHSDILALIARRGLGISPREVELE